jgi:transposase-like protein
MITTIAEERRAEEPRTDEGWVPEVRCPICRSIEWRQDGFVVSDRDARIEIHRVAPPRGNHPRWACGACGFELNDRQPLASALTRLQEIHWE